MSSEHASLEELWDAAISLPPEERGTFIRSLAIDAAVRAELASLLAHAERAEHFFARFGDAVHEVVAAASQPDDSGSHDDESLVGRMVGRYHIAERLGAGGMGVVYRALDTVLERTVALKFLHPQLHADEQARARILIEARAAAALDHANICTIHEVGGGDGTPAFIAMAYYAGDTLDQLLRKGPLPVPVAVHYATQIARGLADAHEHGIIHRDVKPANVMIATGDVVKLLDFGIACTPDIAAYASATPGTIAYMSPEQVRGGLTNERGDLWALGVTLYRMCTGLHPFAADNQEDTLHEILRATPAAPSTLRSDLPAALDRIVARLLQKDPGLRYESAAAVLADLAALAATPARRVTWQRRAVVAAGLIAIIAVGAGLIATRASTSPRILIADAEGDTAAGRIVSERLRQSVATPRLAVIGRPSLSAALTRMGRTPDAALTPATARELALREGFRSYVHVTVDRIGKAYAIGAAIVEPESGDLVGHYQTIAVGAGELAAATDRVAAGLRSALERSLRILPRKEPLLAVTTDSLSALRVHLQAVQANRNGDFRRGIELHDETIAIDPLFADAHQTRAFALDQIGLRAGRAQNSILRARDLLPRLARHERYLVEGDYAWHIEGDLEHAITALRNAHQAIEELEPGRVLNRRSFGFALMLHGDMAEAETVLQAGRRFAPCPPTNSHLVSVLHALGRDADARAVLEKAIDQWPTNPLLGMDRAHFLARDGRLRAAHDDVRRLERGYSAPFALRAEAVFDAAQGRIAEAIEHLEELREAHAAAGMLSPAIEVAAAIGRLRLVAADTAGGVAQLERFLTRYSPASLDPAERPYLTLALFFADARATDRAHAMMTAYQTTVPAHYKGPDRWMQQRVRAALLLATDSAAAALAALHEAAGTSRIWSSWLDDVLFAPHERPELARVYDQLAQRDSAIAVYERYLHARVLRRSEMDAFHLAHTLQRLAVLHAQRNDAARAAHYRARLDAWLRDADADVRKVFLSPAGT
jgi:tRNA A-37 threonylcarbamoyl transferase component Bud32/tetratricopeptide (TPR) repeat protein